MNVNLVGKSYNAALTGTVKRSKAGSIFSASGKMQTTDDDKVNISSQGAMVSGLAGKLGIEGIFGYTPKTPGVINIDELEYYGRKFLDEYNADLQNIFRENNIDTGKPINLENASDGSIVVTNNHPDKAKIEELFKENQEIGNEYKKINNMFTMAAEGREASEFQEAYSRNPDAAVAQYSYLFNTRLEGTIRISDKAAEIFFHRERS